MQAAFERPDIYFLKEMKWVIGSTLLLIGITLYCFGYTLKTLLSQHKLAELKDSFINNMTHELNTPLTSIRITSEALKNFKQTPETQREYLTIIDAQTGKLTNLVSQILNTNRMISASEKMRPLEVNGLIQNAIKNLAPQIEDRHAQVTFSVNDESICINGEAEGLINAFTNIIDNALKYSSEKLCLVITLMKEGKYAAISFADNGSGVPEEYQGKIFEQFFRVPQGNTHTVKGYGLGLSYVKQVIARHQGSVSVCTNPTGGSIFTIRLPYTNG